MADPAGITALQWINQVIQKASTKHYLHNIFQSNTKAVVHHCKSTPLIFTERNKEEQKQE
jgi:hypothetical protein